ncbi:TD and POZ domain-containing protein 5-like isoform X1 [Spodoptera litura]|uniref:TD and POZ domain-containing protein 5-like isoform X1 n=2 Tax=Spodoptera litura TaxID=69820 RepID=A0A9J7IX28_SPOLT|nr:TD and POZ domain-containing protein 5-like isoform X1 [Spodoptera litura]
MSCYPTLPRTMDHEAFMDAEPFMHRYGESSNSSSSSISEEVRPQGPIGAVSAAFKCMTSNATKLCVHDALVKLNGTGDYDIGGTYADDDPEFWFFYTVSVCHGDNRLLNLFVCHRKTGTFSIEVASSSDLTQKVAPGDDVPYLLLPPDMVKFNFKSIKANQNYFIKTFCFKKLDRFNKSCTLFIPIKITVSPKFELNSDIVKAIKLQHDLSGLLTKQETTDYILESASRKQFPTHKILLAAHSPVLMKMIKETDVPSLFIDITDKDMELLLEFIYTGTIKNILEEDCVKLLQIADRFELTQLFTLTQHVIGDQINSENAIEMAIVAKKFKLQDLVKRVYTYIAKNPKVLESEGWKNLQDVDLAKDLFQFSRTMIQSVIEKCRVCSSNLERN